MPIKFTRPGKQTWPSRFDTVIWTQQRPRPQQLWVEYRDVADISPLLCQNVPRIAIVGTHELTRWGADFIDHLVYRLSKLETPVVIVSGVCPGADEAGHRAALKYGIPTIGVLPLIGFSRLRALQQEIISAGGFMLSEYPADTRMEGRLYLERDGLTTALADVVIPVQARVRGGTWATINRAAAQKKVILAPCGTKEDRTAHPDVYAGLADQKRNIMAWLDDSQESADQVIHVLESLQTSQRRQHLLALATPDERAEHAHLEEMAEQNAQDGDPQAVECFEYEIEKLLNSIEQRVQKEITHAL